MIYCLGCPFMIFPQSLFECFVRPWPSWGATWEPFGALFDLGMSFGAIWAHFLSLFHDFRGFAGWHSLSGQTPYFHVLAASGSHKWLHLHRYCFQGLTFCVFVWFIVVRGTLWCAFWPIWAPLFRRISENFEIFSGWITKSLPGPQKHHF